MPQMMPINWILSMIFFIFIFIMFNMVNYFIYNMKYNNKKNKLFFNKKLFIWKW